MSPFVDKGDKALKAAVLLPCPVPPVSIGIVPVNLEEANDVIQAGFAYDPVVTTPSVAVAALPEIEMSQVPAAPDPDVVTNAPVEPTFTPSAVATFVPSPVTPDRGIPVALVRVMLDGVPIAPLKVVKAPEEPTFTAKAVATFVPKPETPVEIGRPVALVKVAAEGVPRLGVVNVGEVALTTFPVPVADENERLPAPSVPKTALADPSASGSVNVTLLAIADAARSSM